MRSVRARSARLSIALNEPSNSSAKSSDNSTTVLNDAGLLDGKRYTAHFSVAKELPNILKDERVVVDGKIVTSRGAGTALDLGLKLVELLVSPEKAREIFAAICA